MKHRLMVMLASASLLAACSTGAPTTPAASAASTPSPGATAHATPAAPSPGLETRISRDVRFESANPVLIRGSLDVYAPTDPGPWPVVVMFHGLGANKYALADYADAVARLGFVVFVPNWGQAHAVSLLSREGLAATDAQNACAVAFAASSAADYGGDPTTLIVFGHSAGAMTGAGLAFSGGTPSQDCLGDATMPAINALVTWEGDWLYAVDVGWNELFASDPTVVDAVSIWPALSGRTDLPVAMLLGGESDAQMPALPVADLDVRDPTGALKELLEESGALADGQVSWAESQELLFAVLERQGNPVTLDTMPGSDHNSTSDAGLAVFVAAFTKVAAQR